MMTLALGIAAALLTFATSGSGERTQQLKGPLGCGIGQCYASLLVLKFLQSPLGPAMTLGCNASSRSCRRV
jgi:hypothetical protein